MNLFHGRHFQCEIIFCTVNLASRYRELQQMLAELAVNVDHSTIYRWVQRYAPETEKHLRWFDVILQIYIRGIWMKPISK